MKKAALHNLGCKVNAYETEAMQQMLEEDGYEIVSFQEQADVYVINTCSVTNIADRKSRQMLRRAKKLNPDSIVVAAGCYVQTSSEEIKKDLSVDIIIGNNKKHELISMIQNFKQEKLKENRDKEEWNPVLEGMIDINTSQEYEKMSIHRTAEHTRAFIKVQDGCNQFCSYCIIPYARGRVRSRSMADILEETTTLSNNGYQEIVLTGIHLSSYGVDNQHSLLELIQEVHKIEGIKRIRLGSLEPKIITEPFVKEIAKLYKVCPHFHLSLQSGCDDTLKRMNRQYTCEEYKNGCELLRKYYEHPAITTDVIVGFPGETEEEFEKTREFLKDIAFYEVHIFKYSKRKGTKAADMKEQVDEGIKTKRSNSLFQDTDEMKREFISWYEDKTVEVLLEEEVFVDNEAYFGGYTKNYVKAMIKKPGNVKNEIVKSLVCRTEKDHLLLS